MQFQPGNRLWERRESHGRPRQFEAPEDLWKACVDYFEWVEENPLQSTELVKYEGDAKQVEVPKMRAMTIGGLCIFIGLSRQGWREQAARGPDFSEIVSMAEEIIFEQKFTGAAAGLLNSNIIARDLGLADKHEQSGSLNLTVSPEDAAL